MKKPRPPHFYLYDWLAPLYDLGVRLAALPFGGEARLRARVLDEAAVKGGQRILEIFSGTATLSLMAARRGASVFALDITEGMLKAAREKARNENLGIWLVRGDAEILPFADGSFDRVMASMGVHEARPEALRGILSEAGRVLKPGGQLAIFDFHRAEGLAGLLQSLVFTFFEGETARAWVRADIQSLISSLGFRDFRRVFLAHRSLQLVTAKRA
ncbi:MAG: methyltransferase domain-containing protein [Deltaproteobacteria bacterium]|nr:methyltransferase domain-containing protein [Deltaproteobacteria bacterium]MBZ0218986.1 methyltransferase domain-containing protein [Deltaproteobacteria bacterium]